LVLLVMFSLNLLLFLLLLLLLHVGHARGGESSWWVAVGWAGWADGRSPLTAALQQTGVREPVRVQVVGEAFGAAESE
jgi:hypothetical protein